ncbi:asl1481 [Nostoc sp. PCC 7120 = FACHB-418]|nr:asl1481 [Nostoc sp. PCC 7120 = FACHB-418]
MTQYVLNILGDFVPLWGKFFGAGDRLFLLLSRVKYLKLILMLINLAKCDFT